VSTVLTLTVSSGEDAGRKVPVLPGGPIRVGRAADANVRIADDAMLSNAHFEISCGTDAASVRDLGSRFGTFLNGTKIAEAGLKDGDEIKAGRTSFTVTWTGGAAPAPAAPAPAAAPVAAEPVLAAPAPPAVTPPPPDRSAAVLRLLATQPGGHLYGLLDAAKEPMIIDLLAASDLEHESLYEGEAGEEIAEFGPWLVHLKPGAELLATVARDGWGQSWGTFLVCEKDFAEVRRHLRKFLLIKLPDGRQVYFRFYDPRVLRTYLPTCTGPELETFFGPIRRLILESPDPMEALEFSSRHSEWKKTPLAPAATNGAAHP
jgi:hypothetical protein